MAGHPTRGRPLTAWECEREQPASWVAVADRDPCQIPSDSASVALISLDPALPNMSDDRDMTSELRLPDPLPLTQLNGLADFTYCPSAADSFSSFENDAHYWQDAANDHPGLAMRVSVGDLSAVTSPASCWSFETNSPQLAFLPSNSASLQVHNGTPHAYDETQTLAAPPSPEIDCTPLLPNPAIPPTNTTTTTFPTPGAKLEAIPAPTKRRRLHVARRPSKATATTTNNNNSGSNNEDGNVAHLRRTHNHIEKQYRNRLNASFDRLLAAALPAQMHPSEEGGASTTASTARQITKAEVLSTATMRIIELQEENDKLRHDLRRLQMMEDCRVKFFKGEEG